MVENGASQAADTDMGFLVVQRPSPLANFRQVFVQFFHANECPVGEAREPFQRDNSVHLLGRSICQEDLTHGRRMYRRTPPHLGVDVEGTFTLVGIHLPDIAFCQHTQMDRFLGAKHQFFQEGLGYGYELDGPQLESGDFEHLET